MCMCGHISSPVKNSSAQCLEWGLKTCVKPTFWSWVLALFKDAPSLDHWHNDEQVKLCWWLFMRRDLFDQAKLGHVFTMGSDNLISCRSDFQSSNSVNWWSNLPSPYFGNKGLWGPSLTETLLPSTAMWPGKVWAPLSLQGVLRGRVQVGEDEKACSSLASPEYQPLPLTYFVSNVLKCLGRFLPINPE